MTSTVWAHVAGNTCDNIIVLDPETSGGYPMDGLVEIDGLDSMPGIGWRFDGSEWTAPPQATLGANDYLISGSEMSTVVYVWAGWPEDVPPQSVDFVVNNGAPQSVPLDVNNMASISVGAADADSNNMINVVCMDMSTIVMVEPS